MPGRVSSKSRMAEDATLTDQSPPHLVDSHLARASAGVVAVAVGGNDDSRLELFFEPRRETQHDQGSSELAKALHGEDSTHHGTAPFGGGEFGRDDTRERVVTANAWFGWGSVWFSAAAGRGWALN